MKARYLAAALALVATAAHADDKDKDGGKKKPAHHHHADKPKPKPAPAAEPTPPPAAVTPTTPAKAAPSPAKAAPSPATPEVLQPTPHADANVRGAGGSGVNTWNGVTSSVEVDDHHRGGLAIGVEAGNPTSVTLAIARKQLLIDLAVGTGTYTGPGVSVHADVQLVVARPTPKLALRVGLGARFYHQGYQPMSIDEIPEDRFGFRAPITLAYAAGDKGAMELYAEAAPGVDVKRSQSCTLASGPASICPHAMEKPLFVQLVVGARWFFKH